MLGRSYENMSYIINPINPIQPHINNPKCYMQAQQQQYQHQLRYYNPLSNKENVISSETKKSIDITLNRCKNITNNVPIVDVSINNLVNIQQPQQQHNPDHIFNPKTPSTLVKPLFSSNNPEKCSHYKTRKYVNNYCQDCSIYIPKNGSITLRESIFKQKLDHNPDQIYNTMLQNQYKNRNYVEGISHLKYRKALVDWMCEIGEELKFTSDAIHLAISYLDTILIKMEVPKNKYQLVCLTCLVIAAKFNEKEDHVPRLKDLYEFCKGAYTIESFKKTELLILELLEWNLKTISPFQFVEHFIAKGVVFSSDKSLLRAIDAKLLRFIRKYAEFLVDLSLQEYTFNKIPANILACSSIAGARKAVGIFPLWNEELTDLTGIKWDIIKSSFEELYEFFEKAFPDLAKKANTVNIAGNIGVNIVQNQQEQANENLIIHNIQNEEKIVYKQTPFKVNQSVNGIKENSPIRHSSNKGEMPIIEEIAKSQESLELFSKNYHNMCEHFIDNNAMIIEEINSENYQNQIKKNLMF